MLPLFNFEISFYFDFLESLKYYLFIFFQLFVTFFKYFLILYVIEVAIAAVRGVFVKRKYLVDGLNHVFRSCMRFLPA